MQIVRSANIFDMKNKSFKVKSEFLKSNLRYNRYLAGATTFSIMTFSIITLNIKELIATLGIKDIYHNGTMLSVILLSIVFTYCYAMCHNAEHRYAKCH
jgi:hypothetical protein